jgi:hypothetical protein
LKKIDDARKVQTALKKLKFYKGAIDGRWGRGSIAALRTFKTSKAGLDNNKAWDLKTQKSLFSASKN